MPLKPIAQLDFSGGANLVVNPYLISQKQAADIQNMVLDEHGSLRTRDGIRLLTTSPDTTGRILYRGILTKVNGKEFPYAIQASGTGAVVVLSTTVEGVITTGSSSTLSVTVGASDTALLVSVHINLTTDVYVASATYAGTPLVRLSRRGYAAMTRTEIWGLINPTVGTGNVIVSFSGAASSGARCFARTFTNVTEFGDADSFVGDTGAEITITSGTGNMVVDAVTSGSTATVTGNHTEDYERSVFVARRAAGQHHAGAASVTMSYTGITAGTTMCAVNLSSGIPDLWDTTVEPWVDQGDLNNEPLPDVVYMNDRAIILHGYAVPKQWTGTALTNITAVVGQTVPPGAKHGRFHLGALWVWNTNPTTTTLDGPSSLRASAVNDQNDWPNANQIFINKDDGQVGMGMSPFTIVETGISPTSTLVVFKNYSGYQITGVFGATTFSIQPIKSDMGCTAPRTIQFVSGFGIIRFTHKGFALYNGVEDRLISEEMRPAIFSDLTSGVVGLDFSNVELSWAAQSQNPPLYVAACPVVGTDLSRIFIYDLIRRGWTICTVPVSVSSLNLVFTRTTSPVIHMGTAIGGQIYEIFNAQRGDEGGVPVEWSVRTRSFFAGNQMTPTYWRRAQISLNVEPNTYIDVTPIVNGGERSVQTFNIDDQGNPGALMVDQVVSPDILETSHTIQLDISGASHAHIRGIEFHAAPKPSTKYVNRF